MRARFTDDELRDAVERVLGGESKAAVVATSTISRSTLKRAVAAQELNGAFERKRQGPKPALPAACEEDLVTWIAAMQRAMLPVQLWEVLEMANELNRSIRGNLRSVLDLTYGWYARFLDRHPVLSKRASESLSRARQGANKQASLALFYSLCQPIIARNMTSAQVFNMDETSFASKHQSQAVVAVRGSSNVWTKMPEVSFHLSVVAAVSANGYAVPPLFILPGKRLRRTTLGGCSIVEAGVMTAEKDFVNANVFELWVDHFADNIPHIPRPVLLICDGCSSHIGLAVLRRCEQRGVILRLLPPNATHLAQPLDVAVFRGYKREVSKMLRRVLHRSQEQSISKKEAVAVASAAYKKKVVGNKTAAINGFRTCGLFPLSIPAMMARLSKSRSGGIAKSDLDTANWLRVRDEARSQIFTLPPSPARKRGPRKTVDAEGKIVRKDELVTTPPKKKARQLQPLGDRTFKQLFPSQSRFLQVTDGVQF